MSVTASFAFIVLFGSLDIVDSLDLSYGAQSTGSDHKIR